MPDQLASVAQLRLYPVKSLDPVTIDCAAFLTSGAFAGDRRFAIVDASGNFVNGKRNAQIHSLRSQFDLDAGVMSLHIQETEQVETFHLEHEVERLNSWLTNYFGFPVQIVQNLEMGFPDDRISPGPTIVSTATLELVTSWFPDLTVEEVRRRFRANIEIAGVPAFWEDQLFTKADETVLFRIGAVQFIGVNPCQRCVVITRNSQTGAVYPNFQKNFVAKRQETLPDWAERSRFNHFFRLAVNTRVPASECGKAIRVGDEIRVYADDRRN
jgi:hypothetical protein